MPKHRLEDVAVDEEAVKVAIRECLEKVKDDKAFTEGGPPGWDFEKIHTLRSIGEFMTYVAKSLGFKKEEKREKFLKSLEADMEERWKPEIQNFDPQAITKSKLPNDKNNKASQNIEQENHPTQEEMKKPPKRRRLQRDDPNRKSSSVVIAHMIAPVKTVKATPENKPAVGEFVKYPRETDVVGSRRKAWWQKHPGNVFYRDAIRNYAPELLRRDMDVAARIKTLSEKVVHAIHNEQDAVFLRADEERGGWFVMDRESSLHKVALALKNAEIRERGKAGPTVKQMQKKRSNRSSLTNTSNSGEGRNSMDVVEEEPPVIKRGTTIEAAAVAVAGLKRQQDHHGNEEEGEEEDEDRQVISKKISPAPTTPPPPVAVVPLVTFGSLQAQQKNMSLLLLQTRKELMNAECGELWRVVLEFNQSQEQEPQEQKVQTTRISVMADRVFEMKEAIFHLEGELHFHPDQPPEGEKEAEEEAAAPEAMKVCSSSANTMPGTNNNDVELLLHFGEQQRSNEGAELRVYREMLGRDCNLLASATKEFVDSQDRGSQLHTQKLRVTMRAERVLETKRMVFALLMKTNDRCEDEASHS